MKKDYDQAAVTVQAEGYGPHRPVSFSPTRPVCEECLTPWPCVKVNAKSRRYRALAKLPEPPVTDTGIDLTWFDLLVVESSGGKDSLAMLHLVCTLASALGILDRVVVVHADLGEVEWDESVDLGTGWHGTADLARRQAAAYGVRFVVVQRTTQEMNDDGELVSVPDTLLDQIERRGKFPDAKNRYCTSDQKRAPARAAMTAFGRELTGGGPARILNIMGMRGQESCKRQEMDPFELDEGATSPTRKWVWRWLPIHDWPIERVWEQNLAASVRFGAPIHPIYAHGLSRASCSFCILASRDDLLKAIRLRPVLAERYAELEERIKHTFRHKQTFRELIAAANEPDEMRSADHV